jgi:AAA+ superfamily predicted ATPase
MGESGDQDPLLTSLLAAVDAAPDDVPLRLHVAQQLADRGRLTDALRHCTHALGRAPADPGALALLQRLTVALAGAPAPGTGVADPTPGSGGTDSTSGADAADPTPATGTPEPPAGPRPGPSGPEFDWSSAEDQLADVNPDINPDGPAPEPVAFDEVGSPAVEDIERPTVTLADVGGMEQAKQRLELTLLGPLRNPDMAKAFGKSLAGGLLLYGPPGCGKTFLARAVAGELGARFYNVGIADVLDMFVGNSERNLAEVFRAARRNAPCVLFLDEVDALGQKRSHLRNSSSMRNTVNQLLSEMDSLGGDNDGVFVLGATNHPWDMDTALRRPGRFDRMLLVLPPDRPARAAILNYHLRDRPLGKIDIDRIVKATEHFSGADLAHVCTTAAERALAASMSAGRLCPIDTAGLEAAVREIRPSTGPWFAAARNVVTFANSDGSYDELAAYLKKHRGL